ncbi:hypothetical protein MMC07_005325 [Pseudocyphellaria aurata]|nr:hypothetical protein [Pseudocyphellaria aurata]
MSSLTEKSLKRGSSIVNNDDSDEFDPSFFMPPSKKTKSGPGDITKSKFQQIILTTMKGTESRQIRPLPTRRAAQAATPSQTPFVSIPKPVVPARAPSGRSPVKRKGVMSNRRKTTRIDPPIASDGSFHGVAPPFSLDSALMGADTASPSNTSVKPLHTSHKAYPKRWQFTIYEDTKDQESEILLTHSTTTMDISDDEGSAKDTRGKENIPPTEGMYAGTPVTDPIIPLSRKNIMTEEPRTPLGSLHAADFYAEGCDEDSFFMVPADDREEAPPAKINHVTEPKYDAGEKAIVGTMDFWKGTLADIDTSMPGSKSLPSITEEISNEASPFDIWESASAKGDETAELDSESHTFAVTD